MRRGKDSFSDWLMHTVLRIHTKFTEHSMRRYVFTFDAVAAVIVFNFCFIPFCTSGPFISHRHYGCIALFRSLFSYLTHDCFGDFFLSADEFPLHSSLLFLMHSVPCAAFCCLLINTACTFKIGIVAHIVITSVIWIIQLSLKPLQPTPECVCGRSEVKEKRRRME